MRIRTAAAAALLAATLTACQSGSDDSAAPSPSPSSTPPGDPRDACLAGLVKRYPSLDSDRPMLDQIEACDGLDDAAKSSVLEELNEYDDALQAAVDAAASKAP
ncbi:hypothetical protein AB0C88_16205 [Streptomyces chartreusis]|uniref:hypothetical protein n=1 Tax=Streptomyces chartreusis TaxID=1969 RepID=UPI0033CBDA99